MGVSLSNKKRVKKSSPGRVPTVRVHLDPSELLVDNFAGGGGASTGIEWALGRSPDIAINHSAEAIAMHAANHPTTRHFIENVWEVDPRKACQGRPVGLAWFSPDCTHFSKSKGGKPRDQKIRGLAWVAVRWAHRVAPRVIVLENVEEFVTWGPLHRQHTNGCTGERGTCRKGCVHGMPMKARQGELFRKFVASLEAHGYIVEWRMLRACDYGAPTTRKRLFLVARRDGLPIEWPEATHGPGKQPYRPAAECIDWTIPCPSIFDRDKPLAENTLKRIARGIRKYVLESGRPFLVPVCHDGDARVHDADEPLPTIAGNRGQHAIVAPYLVHRSNGERKGQAPRVYDVKNPLGTIVAQGQKHAVCAAYLESSSAPVTEPVPTVSASGTHMAQVAAFLVKYNRNLDGGGHPTDPLHTLSTRDRYGLVTLTIEGEEWVVVDIGMRMLTPRELFRAQGFSDDYDIAPVGPKGKPLTKTAQIKACGNSVCPPLAKAVVEAQFRGRRLEPQRPERARAA